MNPDKMSHNELRIEVKMLRETLREALRAATEGPYVSRAYNTQQVLKEALGEIDANS